MRVLVVGAAGQLGQTIVRQFRREHDVVALTRAELDIARFERVRQVVGEARPDAVINCAGFNAVDRAEDEAGPALDCNALAVRTLARAATEAGAALVHYSTDFVFDGETTAPYDESARPAPRSVYGQTKLLGEWFAVDASPCYVLRVASLFGGPNRRSTVDGLVDAIRHGRAVKVFTDRYVSPSYVEDVAMATGALLARNCPSGLYHCVNSGHASWHEIGLEIARLLDSSASLDPTQMVDVPVRAQRPRFSALANRKLTSLGITMPSWRDALARCLQSRA